MSYIGRTPEDHRREQEQKNEQIRETLSYPLKDSTMKERRNLLTASLLGILVAYVGLVPKSLPVFGIDFATNEQENLLILLFLIVIYFTISFYVRAFSDLVGMILVSGRGKGKSDTKTGKMIAAAFSVRLVIDAGVPLMAAVAASWGLGWELATYTANK